MRIKAARDLVEYTGASLKKLTSIVSKEFKVIGNRLKNLLMKKKQKNRIQSCSWTARNPPIAGILPAEAHTLC